MKVENIKISLLRNNTGQIEGLPSNPRTIKRSDLEKLKKSLSESPEMLNLREIIVYPYEGKYVAIGGNQRLRAAKALGFRSYRVRYCRKIHPSRNSKSTPLRTITATERMISTCWQTSGIGHSSQIGVFLSEHSVQTSKRRRRRLQEREARTPKMETKSSKRTKRRSIVRCSRMYSTIATTISRFRTYYSNDRPEGSNCLSRLGVPTHASAKM